VVGLVLLAGRASTSGWASDSSWTSKYEIETYILKWFEWYFCSYRSFL